MYGKDPSFNIDNKNPCSRAVMFTSSLMKKVLARRYKCTVLYATETGKSETFAKTVNEIFKFAFDTKVQQLTH